MKLYRKFLAIHFKSAMAYPSSFFLFCFGRLTFFLSMLLSVSLIFSRFGTVGGYTLPEVLLSYSVVLFGFSIAECFARGFDAFSRIMREAAFDRLLVRPRGLVFQVVCQDLRPGSLVGFLQAAPMLAYAVAEGKFVWTAGRVCTVFAMILGSTVVFFGIFMLYAAVCFFTLTGWRS